MRSLKETWNWLTNLGVEPHFPYSQQRALQVFNILSFVTIPLPPIDSFLLSGDRLQPVPFASACGMSLGFIVILFFHSRRRYLAAKIVYYSTAIAAIIIHAMYFGGDLHIELTLFILFVGAFTFCWKLKESIIFSVICVAGFLACIFINNSISPIHPVENNIIVHATLVLIIFSIAFLLLVVARNLHHYHEKVIGEKNALLQLQKEEIATQHQLLAIKSNSLASSIQYAERIQSAVLPSNEIIRQNFADLFVYYKPRDVVSGDFYWHLTLNDKTYFAVADCTGHGVPGAFMSIMGSSTLNQIVQRSGIGNPKEILHQLDKHIVRLLNGGGKGMHEGMEITLFTYDHTSRLLRLSSANRPYFLQRGNEILEFKGVKTSIGHSQTPKRPFEETEFHVAPGERLYLLTDGITDQFDATNRKKYSIRKLRELFAAVIAQKLSLPSVHLMVGKEMSTWQGDTAQTDDMLMIGIEF